MAINQGDPARIFPQDGDGNSIEMIDIINSPDKPSATAKLYFNSPDAAYQFLESYGVDVDGCLQQEYAANMAFFLLTGDDSLIVGRDKTRPIESTGLFHALLYFYNSDLSKDDLEKIIADFMPYFDNMAIEDAAFALDVLTELLIGNPGANQKNVVVRIVKAINQLHIGNVLHRTDLLNTFANHLFSSIETTDKKIIVLNGLLNNQGEHSHRLTRRLEVPKDAKHNSIYFEGRTYAGFSIDFTGNACGKITIQPDDNGFKIFSDLHLLPTLVIHMQAISNETSAKIAFEKTIEDIKRGFSSHDNEDQPSLN